VAGGAGEQNFLRKEGVVKGANDWGPEDLMQVDQAGRVAAWSV